MSENQPLPDDLWTPSWHFLHTPLGKPGPKATVTRIKKATHEYFFILLWAQERPLQKAYLSAAIGNVDLC